MTTINNDDQFLVQRGSDGYQVEASNLMTIEDNDLMLIQRANTPYKVTGAEVKSQLGGGGGADFSSVVITPLSITPEVSTQYITCSTDIPKVNDAVPADVIWEWYQYDNATGTVGKDLISSNTSRESVDTLILPTSAAGKFIGCSVTYLAVTIEEEARCTIGSPDGPTATMHGLRFDPSRTTNMSNGVQFDGPWTFSGWIKPTDQRGTNGYIISTTNSSIGINIEKGTNKLRYNDGGIHHVLTDDLVQNQWQHIVATMDNDIITCYVDGTKTGQASIQSGRDQFTDCAVGSLQTQTYDGYLSDVYLVEKVLTPDVFGHQYLQGWAPKDSSQVIAALESLQQPIEPTPEPGPGAAGQPYDSRANTDKVWSATLSKSAGNWLADGDPTKAFDGQTSTRAVTDTDESEITVTFSPALSGSVEVALSSGRNVKVNGDIVGTTSGDSSTYDNVGTFDSINTITIVGKAGGFAPALHALKIAGRLLVDNGVWNVSQNWSDILTPTDGWEPGMPPTQGFDGDIATRAGNGGTVTGDLTLATTINVTQKIEVLTGVGNRVYINGSSIGDSDSDPSWVESVGAQTVTEVKVEANGPGTRADLFAIKVDGALLVDAGAQWDTSQRWSDNLTGAISATPSSNAFDGNVNLSAESVVSGVLTYTGSINGNVKLYRVNGAQSETAITANFGNGEVPFPRDRWVDFGTVNVSSFTITDNFSSSAALSAVMVDGKILVDGTAVWNTSQVWSDGATGDNPTSGFAWTQCFDGDLTTGGGVPDYNEATQITFDPIVATKVRIYGKRGDTRSTPFIINGGTDAQSEFTTSYKWVDVTAYLPANNEFTGWTNNRDGAVQELIYTNAVEVNGEILVDGAYTWNIDQVWSKGWSGPVDSNAGPTGAFDGDLTTMTRPSLSKTINWTGSVDFTSLRIMAAGDGNPNNGIIRVNGVDVSSLFPNSSSGPGWETLDSIEGIDSPLTSIQIISTGTSQPRITAIAVNGELLVDKNPFGTDGFYLPFDPAQTGVNYSSTTTVSNSYAPNSTADKVFNGAISNSAADKTEAMPGGTVTFTSPVEQSGNLRVYLSAGQNTGNTGNFDFKLDGTSVFDSSTFPNNAYKWVDFGDQTWTTMSWGSEADSKWLGVTAIEVDGVMLVDHSSIGVDMSGNDNHFADKAFLFGSDSSKTWSDDLTASSTFAGTSADAFDGNVTSTKIVAEGDIVFTPSGGLTGVETLSIWTERTPVVTIVGNEGTKTITGKLLGYSEPLRLPFAGSTITSITIAKGDYQYGYLYGIEVNGKLLTDSALINTDAVLDTPMKNYPVLDEGMQFNAKNGNLTAYHAGGGGGGRRTSIPLPATGKYYFEAYTTNNENQGAGVINGTSMGNPGSGPQAGVYGIFSAVASTYYRFDGASDTNLNSIANAGDVLGIAVDMDNKHITLWKNGNNSDDFTMSNTDDAKEYYFMVMGGNDPSAVIPANFGQQPFAYTPPAGYDGLYQTWGTIVYIELLRAFEQEKQKNKLLTESL